MRVAITWYQGASLSARAIASKSAGEGLEQVAVIPAGLEAFGFDPAPGRGLVLQERQRNAPQQGQVVGRVSRAHQQQPNVLRVSGAQWRSFASG